MVCARTRSAFGRGIIDYPLLRRQLLKISVPTEQALSMFLFAASTMDRANAGSKEAESVLRVLTPLLKFRACRDNIPVATGAMEVRGGNGYIEEWVNARLVRDAHIGVLWEGTSNINALDIITRAVGKSAAHKSLQAALVELLQEATAIPAAFRDRLQQTLGRTLAFAERVAAEPALEHRARQAASALYHVTSAILIAWEAARPGADARRALYARMILDHRLSARDPLQAAENAWEQDAADILLSGRETSLTEIASLLES
jgi:acyl-CoA dehydrogenase